MRALEPHRIDNSTLVSSNVVETLPEYDAGATYAKWARVREEATHTVWESQIDGNTGNPLNDGESWVNAGPTNRHAMFDVREGTVTENAEVIDIRVSIPDRTTGIALFGLDAAYVEVWMTDPIEGEVYHRVKETVSHANVNDFWDYFFAPILREERKLFDDLPPYAGAEIRLRIVNPDGIAKCGSADFGQIVELGATEWGMEFGTIDNSKKEQDTFGFVDLKEGSYRPLGNFKAEVDPVMHDEVIRYLNSRRGKLTVWIGTDRFSSGLIRGFARQWRLRSDVAPFSILSMDLEGLG